MKLNPKTCIKYAMMLMWSWPVPATQFKANMAYCESGWQRMSNRGAYKYTARMRQTSDISECSMFQKVVSHVRVQEVYETSIVPKCPTFGYSVLVESHDSHMRMRYILMCNSIFSSCTKLYKSWFFVGWVHLKAKSVCKTLFKTLIIGCRWERWRSWWRRGRLSI